MRNEVELPDAGELVLLQEYLVAQIIAGLSVSADSPGWLGLIATDPKVIAVLPGIDSIRATIAHELLVRVEPSAANHSVATTTLSGISNITFSRDTTAFLTREVLTAEGSFTSKDGTYGLEFDFIQDASGFHSTVGATQYATSYLWTENAAEYPVSLSGVRTLEVVDTDTIVVVDERSGSDHGGAGMKLASCTSVTKRLADGRHRVEVDVTRSFPSLPPRPGGTQTLDGSMETLHEVVTVTKSGLCEILEGVVSAFDQRVAGTPVRQLRAGEQGSLASSIAPAGSSLVYNFEEVLPIVDGFASEAEHRVWISGQVDDSSGKEITSGSLGLEVDGNSVYSLEFSFDPPLQSPGKKRKSIGQKIAGVMDTTLTCAVAGATGSLTAVQVSWSAFPQVTSPSFCGSRASR